MRIVALAGSTVRRAKPSQDGHTLFKLYTSFLDVYCPEVCVDNVVIRWDVYPVRNVGRAGEEAARKCKESFQWHARGG
jgi:hypothetical protein